MRILEDSLGLPECRSVFESKNIKTNLFESSDEAWDSFRDVVAKYRDEIGHPKAMLPDDLVRTTDLFRENQAWANKLKSEGYTVLDIGNPNNLPTKSPFYEMKK